MNPLHRRIGSASRTSMLNIRLIPLHAAHHRADLGVDTILHRLALRAARILMRRRAARMRRRDAVSMSRGPARLS